VAWSICTALHCVVAACFARVPENAARGEGVLQAVPVNDECTGGVRVDVMEDVVRMAPRTYSWRSKGYVRTRNGGGGGHRVSVWYVLLLVDEFTE